VTEVPEAMKAVPKGGPMSTDAERLLSKLLEQERSDAAALRSEVEGLQAKRAYLEKFVVEQQERIRLLEQACARFLAAFSDCVALRRWDEGYEEWADVEELKTALSRAKALLPKSPAAASEKNSDFAGPGY